LKIQIIQYYLTYHIAINNMGVYPKQYTREEFLKFLKKNNVGKKIINNFEKLPKIVKRNENEFELYINRTWYNIGNTHYSFELNYYSEELIEFLFNSKVFTDIEISINFLIFELRNNNSLKKII